MKKVMFLMAVAGMFAFAACNNNNNTTEEPAADNTEMQQAMPEQEITNDSTNMEAATMDEAQDAPAADQQ